MKHDFNKIKRFFYLYDKIQYGNSVVKSDYVKRFDICSRTFHRDIKEIGYILKTEIVNKSYDVYAPVDVKPVKRINLKSDGLLVFSIIESFYRDYKILPVPLNQLQRDLGLPSDAFEPEMVKKISFEMAEQKRISDRFFFNVLKCIKNRTQLNLKRYRKPGGYISSRVIEPLHLKNYRGQWYAAAWCTYRKELRFFVLSRIEDCAVTDSGFTNSVSADEISDFLKLGYGIMAGEGNVKRVRLRFTGYSREFIKGKIWHRNEKVEEHDDYTDVSFPVEHRYEEILREVMSFHSEVEVLEPEDFRGLWRGKIREMFERFG